MAQLLETNGTSIRTSNNNMDYVKLYNQSENELINEVMPFWLNFGIDEQYGGFICGLKHNGDIDDDSKYAWYQGRGAWIMCKYYEGYKQDPKYLLIVSHLGRPTDKDHESCKFENIFDEINTRVGIKQFPIIILQILKE